jgi:hypothetical protein
MLCGLAATADGQNRHDWQSAAQLQPGDRIRLLLKTGNGPVDGVFQRWTPEEVTAGTVTARKEDVLRIERYLRGGWGRGKKAALGAALGFGGGFAVGAAAGGCKHNEIGPCFSRGEVGGVLGGVGALIGAAIGALLPVHNKDLIYSSK